MKDKIEKLNQDVKELKKQIDKILIKKEELEERINIILDEFNKNKRYEDKFNYCNNCNVIVPGRCWSCFESRSGP